MAVYYLRRFRKKYLVFAVSLLLVTSIWIYGLFQYTTIKKKNIQYNPVKSKVKKNVACVNPKLELWNPIIWKYFKNIPPLKCSSERDWVYVVNGTFLISQGAIQSHGKISCEYVPLVRGGSDFTVENGPSIRPMKSGTPLHSDFLRQFA